MEDSGLISFFRVDDCGLYRMRNKTPGEFVSDNIQDVSKKLYDWIDGRSVQNTIPWDPKEHLRRDKVYCKDTYFDSTTGDYLFVLWFANSEAAGDAGGIDLDSKVGDTANDSQKIDTKSASGKELTVGKPMYYWFIPSLNLVASINFKHAKADIDAFTSYIKKWFDNKNKHPNKKVSKSTHYHPTLKIDIPRVSVSYLSDDKSYSMKFKFRAIEKETNIFSMDKSLLASKISHVVVRDSVSTTPDSARSSGVNLWDKITNKKTRLPKMQQVELVERVSLSGSEVENIIKLYQDEINPNDDWNNIGFRENDDNVTKWFSTYTSRPHIIMDNSLRHNDLFYQASTLWKSIELYREDLLLNIKSHIESEQKKQVEAEMDKPELDIAAGAE